MKFKNKMKKYILVLIIIFFVTLLVLTTNAHAAVNNVAFSAGKGYGDLDASDMTIENYSSYANMGYQSYYSTSPTNSYLLGSFSNGRKRLESDVVFLTGHGTYDSVSTTGASGLRIGSNGGRYIGTNNFDWKKVKLAIFLACETGQETNNSEVNLAYNVFKKSNWTTTSIGWRQKIPNTDALKWLKSFNQKLKAGGTINSAMVYAGSQSGYESNKIKDLAFYGNPNLVLKLSRSIDSSEQIGESDITYIQDTILFNGENLQPILSLLESKFDNFNIDDYDIDIFTNSKENEIYTIDFTYKIGDIYTDSSYTVFVNNGKVTHIANNFIPLNTEKLDTDFSDYMLKQDIAKSIGISKVKQHNNETCISNFESITPVSINNQKTKKYISLKENKKYIQVETEYSYMNSEDTAVEIYKYEL